MRTLTKSTDGSVGNIIGAVTNAGLQLSQHTSKIAGVYQTRDDVQFAARNITGIDALHVEILDVGAECVAEDVNDT
jgi:hypothetical protein